MIGKTNVFEPRPLSEQARASLEAVFRAHGEDWIERRVKLFEAGDYPDKGVNIRENDLHQWVTRFRTPVPVLIEHVTSPLELGFLTEIHVEGRSLFGTVALSPEANALIERNGARSLSVGLSPDLDEVREVSLVQQPRVTDAQIFRDGLGREVQGHVTAGRLLPSQEALALALLACADRVQFDGESVPVSALVRQLIERQPAGNLFSELASTPAPAEGPDLATEESDFYRRYFPGLSLAEIAQRR